MRKIKVQHEPSTVPGMNDQVELALSTTDEEVEKGENTSFLPFLWTWLIPSEG